MFNAQAFSSKARGLSRPTSISVSSTMVKVGSKQQTANSSVGPSTAEDYTIISDLLEAVERSPGSVEARWVLAEQYDAFGWVDAANDIVEEILTMQPDEPLAIGWLRAHGRSAGRFSTPTTSATPAPKSVDVIVGKWPLPGGLTELEHDYKFLVVDAQDLLSELQAFQEQCGPEMNIAGQIADVRAITEGRLISAIRARPPPAARTIALSIKQDPGPRRVDLVCNELEANARWFRNQGSGGDTSDQIRQLVLKRAEAFNDSLPRDLNQVVDDAWMHRKP